MGVFALKMELCLWCQGAVKIFNNFSSMFADSGLLPLHDCNLTACRFIYTEYYMQPFGGLVLNPQHFFYSLSTIN